MNAQKAYNQSKPEKWVQTPIHERLHLFDEVRENMNVYADDLAKADGKMKNELMSHCRHFQT